MRKVCIYCGKRKNKKSFAKHNHSKDNLDSRCKKCVGKHTKIRKKLREKAPAQPDKCQCCGKITTKLCLDHDHTDNSFRGFICSQCNTGIGNLGDNLKGVVNAVNYLLRKNYD